MTNSVLELKAAMDNVLARLPLLDGEPRKTTRVIGMALPLGVQATAPKRIMVFPLGEPPSNDDRKWRFTAADLAKAAEDFDTRTEPLRVLYEHGKGPRGEMAAGWIDSIELAPDGLYANVRWTKRAKAEIEAGEWAFRSPAWDGEESPDGFIYGGPLDHLSLVNDPAIGGMAPVVASSQPSANVPPATVLTQEKDMSEVTAAKAKAATFDKAGILAAIKAAYPSMFGPDFPDDGIAALVTEAFSSMDAPKEDPMMDPNAAKKPETPAVPLFTSAEDEAKVKASSTEPAQTDELKAAKEQIAALTASVKALEARELSGKIINANAADRKSAPVLSFAERIRTQRNANLGAAVSQ